MKKETHRLAQNFIYSYMARLVYSKRARADWEHKLPRRFRIASGGFRYRRENARAEQQSTKLTNYKGIPMNIDKPRDQE
jgi:hypothetical protein